MVTRCLTRLVMEIECCECGAKHLWELRVTDKPEWRATPIVRSQPVTGMESVKYKLCPKCKQPKLAIYIDTEDLGNAHWRCDSQTCDFFTESTEPPRASLEKQVAPVEPRDAEQAESQEGENIVSNPKSWIAWKREAERLSGVEAKVSALEAQLKNCGGDNCMGQRIDGCSNWVNEVKYLELWAERDRLKEALRMARRKLLDAMASTKSKDILRQVIKVQEQLCAALGDPAKGETNET